MGSSNATRNWFRAAAALALLVGVAVAIALPGPRAVEQFNCNTHSFFLREIPGTLGAIRIGVIGIGVILTLVLLALASRYNEEVQPVQP